MISSEERRRVLSMKKELILNPDWCKGCGICAAFCPKKVLAVNEVGKVEAVAEENCIKCGQCEMRCPDYAILLDK